MPALHQPTAVEIAREVAREDGGLFGTQVQTEPDPDTLTRESFTATAEQLRVGDLITEIISGGIGRFTEDGEYVVECVEDVADDGDGWDMQHSDEEDDEYTTPQNSVLQATIAPEGTVIKLVTFTESTYDGEATSDKTDHLDASGNFGAYGQNYRQLLSDAGIVFEEPQD